MPRNDSSSSSNIYRVKDECSFILSIHFEADLTSFLESMYAKRRGVVISLGIDQLCSTVLTPASIANDWDVRSYGLFRMKQDKNSRQDH